MSEISAGILRSRINPRGSESLEGFAVSEGIKNSEIFWDVL